MYSPLVFEELAKATVQDREKELRRIRLGLLNRTATRCAIRSCLARTLVAAGVHLDRSVLEPGRTPDGTASIRPVNRSA